MPITYIPISPTQNQWSFGFDSLNEGNLKGVLCRSIATNEILALLMGYCPNGRALHIGSLVVCEICHCAMDNWVSIIFCAREEGYKVEVEVEVCKGFGYIPHTVVNSIWLMWIISTTQFIWELPLCKSKLRLPFQMRHSIIELWCVLVNNIHYGNWIVMTMHGTTQQFYMNGTSILWLAKV